VIANKLLAIRHAPAPIRTDSTAELPNGTAKTASKHPIKAWNNKMRLASSWTSTLQINLNYAVLIPQ
jgi:hypothetical protein